MLIISPVEYHVVEDKLKEMNEINCGFDLYERSCFQITNGNEVAYAIVYGLFDGDDDLPELARFFVSKNYRNSGFGKLSAVSIINYIFEIKPKVLIDPVNNSVKFWYGVANEFKGVVNLESLYGPKCIWHKI